MFNRTMKITGAVQASILRAPGPGRRWQMDNYLRPSFLRALIGVVLIRRVANWFGLMTAYGTLEARVIKRGGEVINYGVLSYRVVTDAGVAFLVDDFDVNTASGTLDITTLRYHGCGTGAVAETVTDTALGTESTTALNPDSTRATGTQSQPAANQYRSVGTLTFDAGAVITEHGLLSQAATGGGTLWDRSVFGAINVNNGDSIQFTYTLTCSAGG